MISPGNERQAVLGRDKNKMKRMKFIDASPSQSIAELVKTSDHWILATWAADCAERVLPYFEREHPKDNRPGKAIEAGREWARTGMFRMAEVREASLAAHAAAREAEAESAARFAARAAGQAMATTHVPTHSTAAAWYAAKAVWAADPQESKDNIPKEREWQYHHLLELSADAHDRKQ